MKKYVEELDIKLSGIEAKIEELNVLITAKEAEIVEAEIELAEAIETETAQYEAMKLRIQFMYEQGESNYFAMLLSAENFSDMLNKADYIEQLYVYDRNQLQVKFPMRYERKMQIFPRRRNNHNSYYV